MLQYLSASQIKLGLKLIDECKNTNMIGGPVVQSLISTIQQHVRPGFISRMDIPLVVRTDYPDA